MTQTLIEQLEKLQLYWPGNRGEMYPAMTKEGSRPRYVGAEDLRALIEQAKTEQRRIYACLKACDGISTENLEDNDPLLSVVIKYNELLKQKSTQQPDIVAELVKALEDDAYAASFQSMASYRTALIAKVKGVMG